MKLLSGKVDSRMQPGPSICMAATEAHRQGGKHGAVRVVGIVAMPQLVGASEGVLLLGGVELDVEGALLGRAAQHHVPRVAYVGGLQPALPHRPAVSAVAWHRWDPESPGMLADCSLPSSRAHWPVQPEHGLPGCPAAQAHALGQVQPVQLWLQW